MLSLPNGVQVPRPLRAKSMTCRSSSSTSRVVAIRRPSRSPMIKSLAPPRRESARPLPGRPMPQRRGQELPLRHDRLALKHMADRILERPGRRAFRPPARHRRRSCRSSDGQRLRVPAASSGSARCAAIRETSSSSLFARASWPRARLWLRRRRCPFRGPSLRSAPSAARICRSGLCRRPPAPSPSWSARSAGPDRPSRCGKP